MKFLFLFFKRTQQNSLQIFAELNGLFFFFLILSLKETAILHKTIKRRNFLCSAELTKREGLWFFSRLIFFRFLFIFFGDVKTCDERERAFLPLHTILHLIHGLIDWLIYRLIDLLIDSFIHLEFRRELMQAHRGYCRDEGFSYS